MIGVWIDVRTDVLIDAWIDVRLDAHRNTRSSTRAKTRLKALTSALVMVRALFICGGLVRCLLLRSLLCGDLLCGDLLYGNLLCGSLLGRLVLGVPVQRVGGRSLLRIRCKQAGYPQTLKVAIALREIAVGSTARLVGIPAKEGKVGVVRIGLVRVSVDGVVGSVRGGRILGKCNTRDKAEECDETAGLGMG